jgi:hypothetical protein
MTSPKAGRLADPLQGGLAIFMLEAHLMSYLCDIE